MADFLDFLKVNGILTQTEWELAAGREIESISIGDVISEYGRGSDPLTLRQAQMLVDTGIKTLDDMNEPLLLYKTELFINKNKIQLSGEQSDGIFKDSYLEIVTDGFRRIFGIKPDRLDFTSATSMSGESFIYQQVIGADGMAFTTGFVMSKLVLKLSAEELYKRFTIDMPPYGGTDEDAIDLYCEFLNNVNSSCTYRFDVNFDLSLPMYMDNTILTSPRMYSTTLGFLDYAINMFIICDNDYRFSKAVPDK